MINAMEVALEALESWERTELDESQADIAIAALKEAIRAQGSPVAVTYPKYVCGEGNTVAVRWLCETSKRPGVGTKLYTSAPTIPAEGEPEIRWVYREDGAAHIAGKPTMDDAIKYLSAAPKGATK